MSYECFTCALPGPAHNVAELQRPSDIPEMFSANLGGGGVGGAEAKQTPAWVTSHI